MLKKRKGETSLGEWVLMEIGGLAHVNWVYLLSVFGTERTPCNQDSHLREALLFSTLIQHQRPKTAYGQVESIGDG